MTTERKQSVFEFQGLGSRKVVADFGAGDVSAAGYSCAKWKRSATGSQNQQNVFQMDGTRI